MLARRVALLSNSHKKNTLKLEMTRPSFFMHLCSASPCLLFYDPKSAIMTFLLRLKTMTQHKCETWMSCVVIYCKRPIHFAETFIYYIYATKYLEIDTRHGIHITEKAGSYHMSSENWQINLKALVSVFSVRVIRTLKKHHKLFKYLNSGGAVLSTWCYHYIQRCWFGPHACHWWAPNRAKHIWQLGTECLTSFQTKYFQ